MCLTLQHFPGGADNQLFLAALAETASWINNEERNVRVHASHSVKNAALNIDSTVRTHTLTQEVDGCRVTDFSVYKTRRIKERNPPSLHNTRGVAARARDSRAAKTYSSSPHKQSCAHPCRCGPHIINTSLMYSKRVPGITSKAKCAWNHRLFSGYMYNYSFSIFLIVCLLVIHRFCNQQAFEGAVTS